MIRYFAVHDLGHRLSFDHLHFHETLIEDFFFKEHKTNPLKRLHIIPVIFLFLMSYLVSKDKFIIHKSCRMFLFQTC